MPLNPSEVPSWAMAKRRIPFARASSLDHLASLRAIFNLRTVGLTQGGASPCGKPIAKHTAASTHIAPFSGLPSPFVRPQSTMDKTFLASLRVILILVIV
jgi:hypothetical protein